MMRKQSLDYKAGYKAGYKDGYKDGYDSCKRRTSMFVPSLIAKARNSSINNKLAAGIFSGSRLLTSPHPNTQRNVCHGYQCGSLHAEAHAILSYFGKSVAYSKVAGWYLCPRQRERCKLRKKQKVRSNSYPY